MLDRRSLLAAFPLLAALPARAFADAPITAAISLNDERVLIDAKLNGQGPFPFVVDTGSIVSGVRLDVAERLGLKKLRDVRLNENKSFPLFAVDELVLGGAVRQPNASMFGLAGDTLGGEGLIAAGMLTSFDSELDLERGQWRVFPQGAPDRPGYTRLTSRFEQRGLGSSRIVADVALDGANIRTIVDTGMPWVLTLPHKRGRELGLWSDATPYAPVRLKGIAGQGKSLARLVRAKSLRIGEAVYDAPLITVRPPDASGEDAVLGLRVLRSLNLAIDARSASLWVKRNTISPQTPYYSRAGLWIDETEGKVAVREVGAGSPAAKAGVSPGDVFEGVTTLGDALARLRGDAGKPVSLALLRKGQRIETGFTLADYL